jgi:hypothetical protein
MWHYCLMVGKKHGNDLQTGDDTGSS